MADHQQHALDLYADREKHDRVGLSTLSPSALAHQVEARRLLHEYVDNMWETAKIAGLNPATQEYYVGLAAMRDLTTALYHHSFGFQRVEYD